MKKTKFYGYYNVHGEKKAQQLEGYLMQRGGIDYYIRNNGGSWCITEGSTGCLCCNKHFDKLQDARNEISLNENLTKTVVTFLESEQGETMKKQFQELIIQAKADEEKAKTFEIIQLDTMKYYVELGGNHIIGYDFISVSEARSFIDRYAAKLWKGVFSYTVNVRAIA